MKKAWFKTFHKPSQEGFVIGAIYSALFQEWANEELGRDLNDEELEMIFYLLQEDAASQMYEIAKNVFNYFTTHHLKTDLL